jgi:F-type H+-transporting ATPase subunit a
MSSDPHASPDPFSHVGDSDHFEFFDTLGESGSWHLPIFEPFDKPKFFLLITIAALILCALYIPIARKIRTGAVPTGRLWNGLEFLLTFIRDQVAKPAIGEHDYKPFLPFLWTMFFFILIINLLGMLPFVAAATASFMVCGALALASFVMIHWHGMKANHGPVGYLKTFVIHVEAEDTITKILAPFITVGMFFLELAGAVIRAAVLAIRLFANMLAGHTVLFMILVFIRMIGVAANDGSDLANFLFWPVTTMSVGMVTLLSLLELMVACLQAFVFTFLTATFIGLAMHPQH